MTKQIYRSGFNTSQTTLGTAILSGGKSQRMGRPKSQLDFHGETFLATLIRRFKTANYSVVVVGAADADSQMGLDPAYQPLRPSMVSSRESAQPFVRFAQDEKAGLGPLEGLRIGLAELQPFFEFAFVTACDCPLLKLEIIEFMLTRVGSFQAVVPRKDGQVYGLTAIYRTDICSFIEQQLETGQRSVKGLVENLDTKYIEAEELRIVDPNLDSLLNVNSPDDYRLILLRR
jgi:molybdenum cofactor guanylyltransferase